MQGPLEQALAHLDLMASPTMTAVADIVLPEGDLCTIKAGGPGVRSRAGAFGWTAYEVLLSGEPPRFWHRYAANATDSLFAYVPPLLVTHLVTRSGGIAHLDLRMERRVRTGVMDLKVAIPEGGEAAVARALAMVTGAQVLTSRFSLQEQV